jgi:hypothetical protein
MIRGNVCNFDFSSVDYDLSAAFLASPLGWSSWSTLLFWVVVLERQIRKRFGGLELGCMIGGEHRWR